MSSKAILNPIKVGKANLHHRVVLAPLTRFRNTNEGVPTDLVKEYYQQRASQGGLLISEATFITQLGGGYPKIPGIWNKEQINGWKKVTEAVHAKGAYMFNQIVHSGRTGSKYLNPNQEQVVSASAIKIEGLSLAGLPYETPRALEIDEIKSIIQDFRQAALNAIEAGFDGIELHGANGFLIDQFTNSNSNNRTDIYGGSIENRARFALEVVDAVVDAIGADRTAIRFSPGGTFQGMGDDTVIETWSYITSELQKKHPNLAYVHFIEDRENSVNSQDTLEPYRQIWKGPFIASGGYTSSIQLASEVSEKTGSLIAFGRAFIANPDLPERIRNDWELNDYDRSTFYTNEAEGYTDYPFYNTKN